MDPARVEEIERRADAVLATIPEHIWKREELPIPVEAIADSAFRLRVVDVPPEEMLAAPGCPPMDDDRGLSGLLLASRAEIWVNAEEARQWPPRRRFTIGHELGHWILHRSGQQTLFCRATNVQPDEGADGAGTPDIEEEASVFAAALLMPAELVRREYERSRDHAELCRIFQSSGAAMGRRLHQVV